MGDEGSLSGRGSGGGSSVGSGGGDDPEGCLLVKIHVPELNVQKCLQFSRDQLVWDVKQQCLASLPKVRKRTGFFGTVD